MIGAYIGVTAFLAVPIINACLLVDGFRKGGMLAQGKRYWRVEYPVQFWILAMMHAVLLTGYLGLFGYMALNDYLHS
jgi:hypothetical protein